MTSMRLRSTVCSLSEVASVELRRAADVVCRWSGCDLGGIGPRELAALGELAGAGAAQDLLGRMSVLEGETFQPPWVVSVPEKLRLALAGLGESAIAPLAGRWAEVLETSSVAEPELERTLKALAAFARTSAGPWALRVDRPGNSTADDA